MSCGAPVAWVLVHPRGSALRVAKLGPKLA